MYDLLLLEFIPQVRVKTARRLKTVKKEKIWYFMGAGSKYVSRFYIKKNESIMYRCRSFVYGTSLKPPTVDALKILFQLLVFKISKIRSPTVSNLDVPTCLA
jgi:hypothetical protein